MRRSREGEVSRNDAMGATGKRLLAGMVGVVFPGSSGGFAGGIEFFFGNNGIEEPFESSALLAVEDGGGSVHPIQIKEGHGGGVELDLSLGEVGSMAMEAEEWFAVDDYWGWIAHDFRGIKVG